MSDPPRIKDPNGTAPAVARDLVDSAQADAPPAGARERARERLEAALAREEGAGVGHDGSDGSDGSDRERPSAEGPRGTGARNENSVLFSLASLQSVSGTAAAQGKEKPGADSTGAIDLRALSGGAGAGAKSKTAADVLLNVGSTGPLASPLASPVLAPVPTPTAAVPEPEKLARGANRSTLVAGVLISAILAAGGVGIAFLLKPNAPATVVVNAPPAPAANSNAANNAPGNNAPGNSAAAPGTTVADNSNPTPAGADPAANRNDRTREHTRETRDSHSTTVASAGAAGSTPPATTTTQPAQASNTSGCATRCHGNIDCLLRCTAGGGGGGSQPASTAQASSGGGPETPSRNDVISAMGRVRSAVANCAGGQSGTATISITFGSNGHVTSASTTSAPFAGTPAGSCMARAVRSATVPPFTRPSFSVTYPFRI